LCCLEVVRRIVGPGGIPGGSQSCRRKKFSGQYATAKVGHAACTYERQGGIEAPYVEGAEGPRGRAAGGYRFCLGSRSYRVRSKQREATGEGEGTVVREVEQLRL